MRELLRSRSGGEAVADAGVREDVLGAVGRLDLAAQVGDVGAQDLDVVFVLDPPDLDQEGPVRHQAAAVLGLSPSSADRQWVFTRAWLRRELGFGVEP